MIEAREQPSLALEPPSPLFTFKELFRQNLQGHLSIDAGVPGLVDLSHTPGAEERKDLVRPEAGSGSDRHFFDRILSAKESHVRGSRRTAR